MPPDSAPPAGQRILGALIAGGRSTRFGRDKAVEPLGGRTLLDHVADALHPQVSELVVVGRTWPGIAHVADRPAPGLGPLAGLCGALHHAAEAGHAAVLSAPCDALPLPPDLLSRFPEGGGAADGCYLLGLWPVGLLGSLENWLAGSGDRSMRAWIAARGLPLVRLPITPENFNSEAALRAYARRTGLT